MDIPKLFNVDLPEKFAADPDKFRKVGGKFQIHITGAGGGSWLIDATSSGPSVVPTAADLVDVTITIAEPDAQKLLENPSANAMALFFSGKLKVSGNHMLAMKLSTLLA
jgi:putative sterol carrier protein